MSSNIYSTGLRNVGSYLVSGQPYVTRRSVNKNEEIKVELPYISKNIRIKIPNPPNTATRVFETSNNPGAYWWSYTTTENGFGANSPGNLSPFGASDDYTFSSWFKFPDVKANQDAVYSFWGQDTNAGLRMWFVPVNTTAIKGYIKDDGLGSVVSPGAADYNTGNLAVNNINSNWNHLVITQTGGDTKFYINGSLAATASGRVILSSNNIQRGWNANGRTPDDASYDEETMWNTGMTDAQVAELYNNAEWVDPNSLPLKDNLEGWWTYGDDHNGLYAPGITAEATLNVFLNQATGTSVSSSSTLGLHRNDVHEDIEYVPGPFTSQSTGKLRVHLLSTGSASGANIISNKHFKELQGYGTSIEIPAKTKEIYLTGVGGQVTFEVTAELTNIPTGRMYNLTGSGIDE